MISVLLVDSAPDNPFSIRRLLSSSGHNFKLNCASKYRAILDGFRSKGYDVCLIDSDLDTGLKLVAQARSLGCLAPIVMIAPNDAGDTITAIRSGVADCLIRDQLSVAGIEHSLCWVVEQARNIALLNQRERRYLALLDNANQIVYTHDLKGALLSINRTGEQLIGYSVADILGMNICQLVAPEHQVLMKDMIARTLDAQTQMSDKVKLVSKYGRNLLVEINTHPINHDGQTIEIQGMAAPRAVLPTDGRWESRSLTEQYQPQLAIEDNGVLIFRTDEAPNSFLLQETSPRLSRSLFTL